MAGSENGGWPRDAHGRRRVRVLVVEDNPHNLELMAYLLSAFGHTPLLAGGGEQGVRMACEQQPDLILMDLQMPGMDGYAALREIRARAPRGIPVLAVTALAMVGDRERILASGFDGYIAKPLSPRNLAATLDPFLPAR